MTGPRARLVAALPLLEGPEVALVADLVERLVASRRETCRAVDDVPSKPPRFVDRQGHVLTEAPRTGRRRIVEVPKR